MPVPGTHTAVRASHAPIPARVTALALLAFVALSCNEPGAPAPATGLHFVADPPNVVAGEAFSLAVELVDADGHRATGASDLVSIALDNGAPVSGPTTVAARQGVATFDGLVITGAAEALRLTARAGAGEASSAIFRVGFAAPSSARSAFAPDSVVVIADVPTAVVFTFADAYGNPVANTSVSVTSSLAGSRLTPGTGITAADGTFATSFVGSSGGAATFTATLGAAPLTFATSFIATEFCRPAAMPVPGSASGAVPGGVCDVNGRPAAVHRFTMEADGAVAFTPSRAFRPRIDVLTTVSEPTVSFEATAAFPTVEWLLPAGQYSFRIAAIAGSGGAYTIQSASVPGNAGTTARALVTSGTYGGQALSLSDRDFGDGTVYDYFMMYSTRPCTITMRSVALDAFLWVEDAVAEAFAAYDDNGGGGTDARIQMSACNVDGHPIGILANSTLGPGGTARLGGYTLLVTLGPGSSGARR